MLSTKSTKSEHISNFKNILPHCLITVCPSVLFCFWRGGSTGCKNRNFYTCRILKLVLIVIFNQLLTQQTLEATRGSESSPSSSVSTSDWR